MQDMVSGLVVQGFGSDFHKMQWYEELVQDVVVSRVESSLRKIWHTVYCGSGEWGKGVDTRCSGMRKQDGYDVKRKGWWLEGARQIFREYADLVWQEIGQ